MSGPRDSAPARRRKIAHHRTNQSLGISHHRWAHLLWAAGRKNHDPPDPLIGRPVFRPEIWTWLRENGSHPGRPHFVHLPIGRKSASKKPGVLPPDRPHQILFKRRELAGNGLVGQSLGTWIEQNSSAWGLICGLGAPMTQGFCRLASCRPPGEAGLGAGESNRAVWLGKAALTRITTVHWGHFANGIARIQPFENGN